MSVIKEAVEQIKKAGSGNVRKVPSSNGVDIQICESGSWRTILSGVQTGAADDIIRQASNRVILG